MHAFQQCSDGGWLRNWHGQHLQVYVRPSGTVDSLTSIRTARPCGHKGRRVCFEWQATYKHELPRQAGQLKWGVPVHGHLEERHDDILVDQVCVALCLGVLLPESPVEAITYRLKSASHVLTQWLFY